MIFVSTGGTPARSGADTAQDFLHHGIRAIELSGGASAPGLEASLVALRDEATFQVHNYFPPPSDPFVLNLASADREVHARSMAHVRTAIRWASSVGQGVYSFHAGFRITPEVRELGRPIAKHPLRPREEALSAFGDAVLILSAEARREGVRLLVENNVVSAANLATFGEDPLLLCQPGEMAAFMSEMPTDVGLLLDVAHLKVSATSLGFDAVAAHALVLPWIRAYHLSDNDGLTDSNGAVTTDSWFWGVIDPGLDYYSLEVYGVSAAELARQQAFTAARLATAPVSHKMIS